MDETNPTLDYLATCSNTSLEAFELARLNRAANLRKEIRQALDEWIEAEGEARFARWVLERRRTCDPEPGPLATRQTLLAESTDQIPLPFLATSADLHVLLPGCPREDSPGRAQNNERREVVLATAQLLRPPARKGLLGSAGTLLSSGRIATPRPAHECARTEATVEASDETLDRTPKNRVPDVDTQGHLHPAMCRGLVRPAPEDPFGEANHAPRVETWASVDSSEQTGSLVRQRETQLGPPFRVYLGRRRRGRDVAAAS